MIAAIEANMQQVEWFFIPWDMEAIDWLLILLSFMTLGNAIILWFAYEKQKRVEPPVESVVWLKYSAIFNFIMAPLMLLGAVFIIAIRAGVFLTK